MAKGQPDKMRLVENNRFTGSQGHYLFILVPLNNTHKQNHKRK